MASKAIANTTLVLRIFTLLFLAGFVVVLATNSYTLSYDGIKKTFTFKDVTTYRYVLGTGIIGIAYTLLQIPFAIYYVRTEKRVMPGFEFYADKVIIFVLAMGVSAGFAVSFEMKKFVNDFIDIFVARGFTFPDGSISKLEKFLDRGNIATGLLFLGLLCMAVLSVLSSIHRATRKDFYG